MKPAAWGTIILLINIKFAYGELGGFEFIGSSSFLPLLLATTLVAYVENPRRWSIKRFLPALEKYEVLP